MWLTAVFMFPLWATQYLLVEPGVLHTNWVLMMDFSLVENELHRENS